MNILSANYIDKLCQLRYLNRGIVFISDLIFSVAGSVISYIYILSLFDKYDFLGSLTTLIISSTLISIFLFTVSRLYKIIIRHSTLKELPKIFFILILKEILLSLVIYYFEMIHSDLIIFCAIIDLLFTSFLMIGVRVVIVNIYYSIVNTPNNKQTNVFIYSTQGRSPMLADQISKNTTLPYRIHGFLTTNKNKDGIRIAGESVYFISPDKEKLIKLFRKEKVNTIIFTSNENFNRERNNFVEFCIKHHIEMLMIGEIQSIDGSKNAHRNIKPIQIEDLLDREEIIVETEKIKEQVEGKVVLVTGAAGSIGREITMQLASFNVKQLVLFDNAETPLHNIQLEIEERFPNTKVVFSLGDIRSRDRLNGIFKRHKPAIVFHAAAYKHVPMIENNPCEAILVNVWGTINLANHAIAHGIEKFIMISTDKAVNPTNVMGASKRIAEMCVQNLNNLGKTKFITTRFGNVLGSNGSVIPRFKKQIAEGGPVTVTHPDIIRYFMTIPEACRLVLQAASMGNGGEIFVFDMGEQVKIADLARKMILLSGFEPDKDIEIKYTGLRPGEKLYEELLSDKEETESTSHHKIRIAPSNSISSEIDKDIRPLIISSVHIDIERTVKMMKKIVPEFISNNSVFEKYDKTE